MFGIEQFGGNLNGVRALPAPSHFEHRPGNATRKWAAIDTQNPGGQFLPPGKNRVGRNIQ
ncbi:MAG TPA: hypothetical protein VN240_03395 [Propylenella sp.]|nr:hypothetical protein [Propylenella sp.]